MCRSHVMASLLIGCQTAPNLGPPKKEFFIAHRVARSLKSSFFEANQIICKKVGHDLSQPINEPLAAATAVDSGLIGKKAALN